MAIVVSPGRSKAPWTRSTPLQPHRVPQKATLTMTTATRTTQCSTVSLIVAVTAGMTNAIYATMMTLTTLLLLETEGTVVLEAALTQAEIAVIAIEVEMIAPHVAEGLVVRPTLPQPPPLHPPLDNLPPQTLSEIGTMKLVKAQTDQL